ncbi:metallophosphoesterase family protein [Chitinophaga ginsengisoli]|uniref:Serine/threonine protein phosphatase 1 n=1 Tax=Chitinophaga ginsengisoli TaxID=363837 RepID=A0A2P8GI22_9BACT|nr:metallophosphoesterase family protein [Chitinophaga ginsengisoli]PSL33587.1 serine/threonine protein phosphatase 1 [Chitinophaga ginsengisoli]
MARTFVIGDIHGALRALEQVLERVKLKADDQLIFLGDYVDGWSQSAQVIDYLMQLEKQYHCTFIKGNHDAWCESWLMGGYPDQTWQFNGGRETVASYDGYSQSQKNSHIIFFNRMKDYVIDAENRLFIHAGFTSMHGPAMERYDTSYHWDRTLWEMAITMDKRIKKDSKLFPKRLLVFNEIFIGHTPTINYDVDIPMNGCNVWNVDTGAAFYGKLTAMDIDTKKFWQSDPVQQLYPNEKGRNR